MTGAGRVDDEGDVTVEAAEADPEAAPAPSTVHLPEVFIVAVGASSHGFASLERLFAAAPAFTGAAWVVAFRRDEALSAEEVARRLGDAAPWRIEPARDGLVPRADHLYVAPADGVLTYADGALRVGPAAADAARDGAVDSLMSCLAEQHGHAAVGVLLNGLGSQGTAGVTALKKHGGLLVCERDEVQDSEAPAFAADPRALADFTLDAGEIAPRIAQYVAHLRASPGGRDEARVDAEIAGQIGRVAAVLRNRTGHDFHGYKHGTFLRRIQRRMQVNAIDAVEPYIEFLRSDVHEVHHLFQDLLIGVTQFFRDRAEFDVLEREVVPGLFEGKGAADQLRVWVLGCATGEEAYSIAMLLREHMAGMDAPPQVQIFATDIDGRALGLARAGRYPSSISKDVSLERLQRWFVKEGATYVVSKPLREMCIFSQHNVIKDAPFSRIDLCSCRNLLIYLTGDLQDRVIPLFHFALRPEGYLFLGSSESVTRHNRLFAPIGRKRRIFRRLETDHRIVPQFPLSVDELGRTPAVGSGAPTPAVGGQLSRQAERIAERHAPAHVLVDGQYEVLSFSGRTGRYLEPAPGTANLTLVNLVHRDLRMDLRAALQRAALDKAPVRIDGVVMDGDDEDRRVVDLIVEPLPGEEPPGFVVLFQEHSSGSADGRAAPTDAGVLRDEHVKRLEAELRLSRERLQATIEELESTNEELKSSNEEYQSINEELQSANEELETSKEELQSVNEELQTVNGELAQRVVELGRANSDLKNLFDSTHIATVFLENDLRVKSFTPAMGDVFHLIETDVGRPLNHIASRIPYPELGDDVRRVLRSLSTIERELQGGDRRYHVRVLPYRSVENYIAGVVLTFLDISEVTRAQTDLRRSEARLRTIADLVPDLLWACDREGRADWCNERWLRAIGQTLPQAMGRGWAEAVHPDERAAALQAFAEAARSGETYTREHRLLDAGGGYRWHRVVAIPAEFEGEGYRVFGAATDVHDFHRTDRRHRLLVAELQHRVKNILTVVRAVSTGTLETAGSLEDYARHFSGRLDALARTQGAIARRGEAGVELEDLVRDELAASAPVTESQVRVSGRPSR